MHYPWLLCAHLQELSMISQAFSYFLDSKMPSIVRSTLNLVTGFQEKNMYITTEMNADQSLFFAEY